MAGQEIDEADFLVSGLGGYEKQETIWGKKY